MSSHKSPDYKISAADKVLRSIPKEHYRNIIKGAYERDAKPPEKESRARPLKNYL